MIPRVKPGQARGHAFRKNAPHFALTRPFPSGSSSSSRGRRSRFCCRGACPPPSMRPSHIRHWHVAGPRPSRRHAYTAETAPHAVMATKPAMMAAARCRRGKGGNVPQKCYRQYCRPCPNRKTTVSMPCQVTMVTAQGEIGAGFFHNFAYRQALRAAALISRNVVRRWTAQRFPSTV